MAEVLVLRHHRTAGHIRSGPGQIGGARQTGAEMVPRRRGYRLARTETRGAGAPADSGRGLVFVTNR